MSFLARLFWSAAAALVLLAPSGSAQTCPEALSEAEARYVEGAFGTVIGSLDPCLDDTPRSIPARRLIALAHLRLGEITEAKLALLDILAIQPSYRADLVQDPPAYRSLVQVVQAQVTAQAPAPPAPEPADPDVVPADPDPTEGGPPEAVPPADPGNGEAAPVELDGRGEEPAEFPITLRYWVGAGSYGGERGIPASGPIQEFAENAGFAFGAGIEGPVLPWLRVFGDVEAGYYPTLPTVRGRPPVFDPIDEAGFSAWVRFATAGLRATAVRTHGVSLYGAVGGGIASGDHNLAGVVSAGFGTEVSFSPTTGMILDGTWSLTLPARAIDAAAQESAAGDLFSAIRVGLLYRIGTD